MKIELYIPPESSLDLSEFDYKMILGVALYEKGIMSSALAARILGIDRAEFILNMDKYGKSIYEKPKEEIRKDGEVAGRYIR